MFGDVVMLLSCAFARALQAALLRLETLRAAARAAQTAAAVAARDGDEWEWEGERECCVSGREGGVKGGAKW